MKLIIWFAKNPIAANFLMVVIIAGGLLGLSMAKRYALPPIPQNQLEIDILYPNAGPSEVEQALCIPIEEALYVLEGIKNINSFATQGKCELFVEFDPTLGSISRFQSAVQAKITAIPTLPKAAEGLKIEEVKTGVTQSFIVMTHAPSFSLFPEIYKDCQAQLVARDWGNLNWQWKLRGGAEFDRTPSIDGTGEALTIHDIEQTELVQNSEEREKLLFKALRELIK